MCVLCGDNITFTDGEKFKYFFTIEIENNYHLKKFSF